MKIFPNEKIADILNITFIDNSFFYLDYWSIIHVISGFVLLWFLMRYKFKPIQTWICFILILVIYEIFEVLFYGTLFRWESNANIISDLVIGILGGVIAFILNKKNGKNY